MRELLGRKREAVAARSPRRDRVRSADRRRQLSAISCSSRRSDASEEARWYAARSARRAGQVARQLLRSKCDRSRLPAAFSGTTIGVFGVRVLKSDSATLAADAVPRVSSIGAYCSFRRSSRSPSDSRFGIAPALLATRVDPTARCACRSAGSTSRAERGDCGRRSLSSSEVRARDGARRRRGLMTQSLWRLSRVDLGFDPRRVLQLPHRAISGQARSTEQATALTSARWCDGASRAPGRGEGRRGAALSAQRSSIGIPISSSRRVPLRAKRRTAARCPAIRSSARLLGNT